MFKDHPVITDKEVGDFVEQFPTETGREEAPLFVKRLYSGDLNEKVNVVRGSQKSHCRRKNTH